MSNIIWIVILAIVGFIIWKHFTAANDEPAKNPGPPLQVKQKMSVINASLGSVSKTTPFSLPGITGLF
jgi:hypothetical protein